MYCLYIQPTLREGYKTPKHLSKTKGEIYFWKRSNTTQLLSRRGVSSPALLAAHAKRVGAIIAKEKDTQNKHMQEG